MEPKVSVIIPVYNVEKYLRECLDSVLGQTLKDIEVICVDDGSTDSSLDILREYKQKDSRVKVLTQPNTNAGAARNNGIRHARGKFYSFLDSDDIFDPNMLETCYDRMELDQSDVAVFLARQFDMRTGKTSLMPWSLRKEYCPDCDVFAPEDMSRHLFNAFKNWPWNKMFRAEFVAKNRLEYQEIPRTNDMAFVCLALAHASRISVIHKPLMSYRVGTGTSLQSTNDRSPLSFWDAFCETKRRLEKDGLYEKYQQSMRDTVLSGALYNLNAVKTWDAYQSIYHLLKVDINREFRMMDCSEEEFLDPKLYAEFSKIQAMELDQYMYTKWCQLKGDNARLSDEVKRLKQLHGQEFEESPKIWNKVGRSVKQHGLLGTSARIIKKVTRGC